MEELNTNNAPAAIGPYSQAVKDRKSYYLHQVRLPLTLQQVKSLVQPITEQTEQVMKNLRSYS